MKRAAGAVTRLAPTLTVFANNQRRDVPDVSAAGGFEYVIESVDRTFSYDVSAGSARSSRYTVTVVRPPRVARIDLHYVYPSFAGLPPRDEQDGGDIYAPAGRASACAFMPTSQSHRVSWRWANRRASLCRERTIGRSRRTWCLPGTIRTGSASPTAMGCRRATRRNTSFV